MFTDHVYRMPGALNFSDYDDTERELPRVQTTVGFEGDVWMPVRTSLGLMFIDPAYLKPLKDLDTEPELKERQAANGGIYIAVKRGMELKAVILPIYQGEPLLEELETLTKELSVSISRRKMMEQVDPETGEVVEEDWTPELLFPGSFTDSRFRMTAKKGGIGNGENNKKADICWSGLPADRL